MTTVILQIQPKLLKYVGKKGEKKHTHARVQRNLTNKCLSLKSLENFGQRLKSSSEAPSPFPRLALGPVCALRVAAQKALGFVFP